MNGKLESLAVNGGAPIRTTPLPGHDRLMGQDEIDALTEVIQSGQLGRHGGTKVKELERAFAERYGVKHAIAVSSGSACSSGRVGPSHVLKAMGFDADEGAIRLSIGPETTEADIGRFEAALADLAARRSGRPKAA